MAHQFPVTNILKDFCGDASNHAPISCNIPSERTYHICCCFFFNREPIIQNMCTSLNIVDFEGNETLGNSLLNFLQHDV
jgi:hypothetical protein